MNHPQVDSGIIRPRGQAGFSSVSKGWAASRVSVSQDVPTQCLRGRVTLQMHGGDNATPVGLEDRALNQRGLFWTLQSQWNLPCEFWACLGLTTPSLFLISPFRNGNICPTTAVCKYITRRVSQAPSWTGILPQAELYLQSHHT